MSYAPQSIRAVADLVTAKGYTNLGIVGDTMHQRRPSYHNGADVIRRYGRTAADDYTIRHPRDVAGLSDAASALDIGPGRRGLRDLREFTRRLGEAVIRVDPDTRDIRDVIGSPDGATVKCWISPQVEGGGRALTDCADTSHLWHTHVSWFRDARDHDLTPPFRRLLTPEEALMLAVVTRTPFPSPVTWRVAKGTTLRGYDPARPGKAVKETTFGADSSAHATARVGVAWPGAPDGGPVPRGAPFLEVSDGFFAGLLIVEAYVTLDPLPDPCADARDAARRDALESAAEAIRALLEADRPAGG